MTPRSLVFWTMSRSALLTVYVSVPWWSMSIIMHLKKLNTNHRILDRFTDFCIFFMKLWTVFCLVLEAYDTNNDDTALVGLFTWQSNCTDHKTTFCSTLKNSTISQIALNFLKIRPIRFLWFVYVNQILHSDQKKLCVVILGIKLMEYMLLWIVSLNLWAMCLYCWIPRTFNASKLRISRSAALKGVLFEGLCSWLFQKTSFVTLRVRSS